MPDTVQLQVYDAIYMDSILIPYIILLKMLSIYALPDIRAHVENNYTIIFMSGNQLSYDNVFR